MSLETSHPKPYTASDSRRAMERSPQEQETIRSKDYLSVEEGESAGLQSLEQQVRYSHPVHCRATVTFLSIVK